MMSNHMRVNEKTVSRYLVRLHNYVGSSSMTECAVMILNSERLLNEIYSFEKD
jgi:hypothetical protein